MEKSNEELIESIDTRLNRINRTFGSHAGGMVGLLAGGITALFVTLESTDHVRNTCAIDAPNRSSEICNKATKRAINTFGLSFTLLPIGGAVSGGIAGYHLARRDRKNPAP